MQKWYWRIDKEQMQLSLIMDETVLQLAYKRKHLKDNIPNKETFVFTMEECATYNEVIDYLNEHSPYQLAQKIEIAAHAVAAISFGKALMPQSWHFQHSPVESWPQTHKFATLNSGFSKGTFLVIEQDDNTALCLLTDAQQIEVSPAKKMNRFDTIRVLKDRLQSHDYHPISLSVDSYQQMA